MSEALDRMSFLLGYLVARADCVADLLEFVDEAEALIGREGMEGRASLAKPSAEVRALPAPERPEPKASKPKPMPAIAPG